MLVDSHCHLDFPDFADTLDDVVARAAAAGVGCLLTICTRPDRIDRTLAIIDRYPNVYGAVGVHPHEAKDFTGIRVGDIVALTRHPKIVGIGETGLDFHYDLSPRDTQAQCFRMHIRAARETGLPFIVHSRSAEDETLRLIAEEGADHGSCRGIIHCFSGTAAFAERAMALGLHISFSGIATFPKADEIRGVARTMPADRMLVETDAPYLAPVPRRGKGNEPAFVAYTARRLAQERGWDEAFFGSIVSKNFFTLFDRIPDAVTARCG
jgi:TatD DNase family protein